MKKVLFLLAIVLLSLNSCNKKDDPIAIINPSLGVIPPDTLSWASIQAGTFTMGSPVTEAQRNVNEMEHQVTLSAFKMSKFEVTNTQFAKFLNQYGSTDLKTLATSAYPGQVMYTPPTGVTLYGVVVKDVNGVWKPMVGYENHPAILMSWYGANEFASFYGLSLPTEAQWEYACRTGTTTPFNTDSCLTNLQANYNWNFPYGNTPNTMTYPYFKATQRGGLYAPNAWNLYDMHGNAAEWCSDWYGVLTTDPATDPIGSAAGTQKVIRGGSYASTAAACRSAFRNMNGIYGINMVSGSMIGFRVVKTQ